MLSGVQAQQAVELDGLKTDAANAHNLANNLKPGDEGYQKGATNTVGVSVSYGSQSSKSETHTDSRQSESSTLNAGQNLSITATGKNKDTNPDSGNITVVGSELKAGKDLSLSATQDINLNSSKGSSVGVGVGVGAGGPIGGQLLTNAAGGLLSNANNSGHAEGTTQSAVSDGTLIVRDSDKQKQDIDILSRDTEHANDGSINPIFDKEKEQNRLKQSQLIGEIGNQAMDIIRTEGDIAGYKAQKDPDALALAKKQLEAAGKTPQKVAEERINAEIEHYKKENCAGMSTGACSAKMAEDRDKFFREAASLGIDFVPVVGDFKSFAEADGWIDYTLAAAGTLPFAKIFTKPLKEAKLLLKAGDLDGANKLIKEASDGIPTKLPSNPTSQSSSGAWKPSDSKINAGKYQISNGSPNAIDKGNLANPITQSRINVQNGDSKAGWEHVIKRHFSGNSNASQFTITESELKSLLQNPEVVKIPISKTQTSLNKATGKEEILYQRTIILDKQIGIDKFSNGPTNKMTILTDKQGNLVTATPGVIN